MAQKSRHRQVACASWPYYDYACVWHTLNMVCGIHPQSKRCVEKGPQSNFRSMWRRLPKDFRAPGSRNQRGHKGHVTSFDTFALRYRQFLEAIAEETGARELYSLRFTQYGPESRAKGIRWQAGTVLATTTSPKFGLKGVAAVESSHAQDPSLAKEMCPLSCVVCTRFLDWDWRQPFV